MTSQDELSQRIAEAVGATDYQVEDLVLSLTSEFIDRMDRTNVSRTELARRLGVQPPRVTRILQGNDNFTLRTLVQVAQALDCRLAFALEPCGTVPDELASADSSHLVSEVDENSRLPVLAREDAQELPEDYEPSELQWGAPIGKEVW